jgi:hypothetical protein
MRIYKPDKSFLIAAAHTLRAGRLIADAWVSRRTNAALQEPGSLPSTSPEDSELD